MYRPDKHIYLGGSYTDIKSISTNTTLLNRSDTESIYYDNLNTINSRLNTLVNNNNSSLSTISANIAYLDHLYVKQNNSSIRSYEDKERKEIDYIASRDNLSTISTQKDYYYSAYSSATAEYSSIYINASMSISKMYSTINELIKSNGTPEEIAYFNENRDSQFGGGIMNISSILTRVIEQEYYKYIDEVTLSTQRVADIKATHERISTLNNYIIPSSLSTINTLSSQKRTDMSTYYEELYQISTTNIDLKGINDEIISTIRARESAIDYIRSNNNTDALGAIASDDARKRYISSLNYELNTYSPYNSTMMTMKAIENIYNLVVNNLEVPDELTNFLGTTIQSGGAPYNPSFIVSSIVCAPDDTECIRKRDYFNRYLSMYYTLSTVLPTYQTNYENGKQARIDAEQYTTIRLQQIIDDMNADYTNTTNTTLADITSYEASLALKQDELSKLQELYSSSVLQISSNIFTPEELAYMTEIETQVGGSTDSGGNQIRRIRKANYSNTAIETRHQSSLKVYKSALKINATRKNTLENIYLSTLKQQQIMTYRSEIRATVIEQKERELNIEMENNRILQQKLNTLQYESTMFTRAISSFNTYTISGSATSGTLSSRNTALSEFDISTSILTNELSTSMSLEFNTYLNIIQTISSYITYDIAMKSINDANNLNNNPFASTNNKVISLYSHIPNIEVYIESLKAERLVNSEYIQAKRDYELTSSRIMNSSDPANKISDEAYTQIKFRYDLNIAYVNKIINTRKITNVVFIRDVIEPVLNLLEPETKLNIQLPKSQQIILYNDTEINVPKTYKTTNSGVGNIINDAISNTAFGKITYDSTTGDIFVFNLNTLWLQRLTADLSSANDYCNFNNASDDTKSNSQLYIKAHNGVVYGVDYVQSELYSVNSYNTKTKVNTTVGSVNMLNRPIGIEVRHPQVYILNSDGENIVIRINITTGTIETVLSTANTNIGSYTPIKGFAVNLNSSKIYLNSGSRRVIGFDIPTAIPITGTPIDIIGTTETGYIDANGTNARFNNITDMCINSDNRLYLTDLENRAIRTIDVLTKSVRTYTSGSYIRTNTPTTYTLGMTISAKSIRCPSSNGNILNNYMDNLYSLCITPDSVLCVSYNFGNYNDNVVNNALPYRKSAVSNTSISFIPFDDKFKASYFSLTPTQLTRFTLTTKNLPSLYPYTMEYKLINTNTDIFSKYSKYIPSKTITCVSTNVISGAAADALVIPTPTTTLDTVQYGTKCRYIEIRKEDMFEILQLIILDKNGKNIGYKKDIRIMPSNSYIYDVYQTNYYDTRSVLDGRYDRTVNTTPFIFFTDFQSHIKYVRIDLGAVFDVTAIVYLKTMLQNSVNSVGLTISLFDESNTKVTSDKIIQINNAETTIDLRNPNLPSAQRNLVPISLRATRYGVCGTMGRYVKLSKADNPAQSWYRFRVSQISVIAPDGTNLALNKSAIRNISGNQTSTSFIVNGKYMSFPPGPNSFTHDTTNANYFVSDHIMIDLGGEYEIAAVNIYYSSDVNETAQGRITILTEDNLVAQEKVTSSKNAGKEILDFRFAGAPKCYTTVKWEDHYGVAGIKARYIRLKKNGTMSFSKVEVVDKTGLDIAQDCNVTVDYNSNTIIDIRYMDTSQILSLDESRDMNKRARNANSNILGIRRKEQGYSSANKQTNYTIDFGMIKEVCNIRLYGCSDADEMNGIQIELLINLSTTTPYTVATISGNDKTQSFDTRYEPTVSTYPTTVTRTYVRTGPYGVYAQYIYVYNTSLTTSSSFIITDANGIRITPTSLITETNRVILKLGRNYEITSVAYPSFISDFIDIALYDCNSIVVAVRIATNTMSYANATFRYADFRTYRDGNLNQYAPIMPYNLKRGGYSLENAFRLTGQTGFSSVGVKARYIKIIPRNSTTPLYISQIIAVDEFGINRAFEKQTYQQLSSNPFPTNGKNAVDGVYEASFDTTEFLSLYFKKYKQKSTQSSYDSSISANAGITFFAIDLGLDTVTNISWKEASKGNEYSINSVIFVASEGKGAEADGVIVQLIDDSGTNIVGSQTVTYMASVFGLDILDFRADTTVNFDSNPNRIEVRERVIEVGTYGILTQYIRIEQTDPTKQIELSQVIVTDVNGVNVAMYQPTFSSSGNDKSYLIVDGADYTKNRTTAFRTTGSESNKYVEINLGMEYELNEIQVADIYEKSDGYNTLRVRLYNKHRDVIGSHKTYIEPATNQALGVTGTADRSIKAGKCRDDFLYLEKVGVKAANSLIAYKNSAGLVPDAAVKDSTEDKSVPDVLIPPTNTFPNTNRQPRFTRSADGGIPTRYVRVYNVNNHIQVSQLMIYNTAGVNVAYRTDLPISQRKLPYATSTLPNKYAYYAIDGEGGFFHTGRDESKCFISGNNRYDYLEIDLVSVQNIIAVRYIPPSTNNSRNIGTRVQLLNESKLIMSELVVKTHGDTTLDFRKYTFNMPTIDNYISPIINTLYLHSNIYMRTLYISYNSSGTVARYFDLFDKKFYETVLSSDRIISSNNAYSVLDIIEPTSMHELQDGMIYIVDYTRNKVYTFPSGSSFSNYWDITPIITNDLTNPYSITIGSADSSQNRKLFISEYRVGGNIYRYNKRGNVISAKTTLYTADYIMGISVNELTGDLYACVQSTKCIMKIPADGSTATVFAGSTATGTSGTYKIPLESPCAILIARISNGPVTPENQIMFIADDKTNMIYAIANGKVYTMAGTGSPGYTGDSSVGKNAKLNMTLSSLHYDMNLGFLYFLDTNNKAIRRIDIGQKPIQVSDLSLVTTTTLLPLFTTTTIPGTTITTTIPQTTTAITSAGTSLISPYKMKDTTIVNIIPNSLYKVYTANRVIYSICMRKSDEYIYIYMRNSSTNININTRDSNGGIYRASIISGSIVLDRYYQNTLVTDSEIYSMITTQDTENRTRFYLTARNRIIYSYTLGLSTELSRVLGVLQINNDELYTPDGPILSTTTIRPHGISFNTVDKLLYFTEIYNNCGLVRRINGTNLETVVGIYLTNSQSQASLIYPISDFIKAKINPLTVLLNSPQSIIHDNLGNLYIADYRTHSIHRLTTENMLEPVCGPFSISSKTDYLHIYGTKNQTYNAYSVKIQNPNYITFDSDMNLICTSLSGHLYRISRLNELEPVVEIIMGGVNDNTTNYSDILKSSNSYMNNPRSLLYSHLDNSLYFIESLEMNYSITKVQPKYNKVIFNGAGAIIPYGYFKEVTPYLTNNITSSYNNICIDNNNNLYYTENKDAQTATVKYINLSTYSVKNTMSQYKTNIYKKTLIFNTGYAFGKMTYDPITKDIFVFNYNTLWLQKVSSDLTTVTNYCDFNKTTDSLSNSRLYIRAYNGIVYAVDFMQSELYAVTSSNEKTQLNTLVNTVNMLNKPVGIELRYPYLFIINSLGTPAIIRYNINTTYIDIVAPRSATSPIGSTDINYNITDVGGITVSEDGSRIYIVDKKCRILGYNLTILGYFSIPIVGAPWRIYGADSSAGCIDGNGSNARFSNITDICMDSNDNIFVTESYDNHSIRKIDTKTDTVTTYTTGTIYTSTSPQIPSNYVNNLNYKYTLGGTVHTTNLLTTNSNNDIDGKYMLYPFSLCITPISILCSFYNFINDDNDTVSGSTCKRKNKTANTSIASFPYIDLVINNAIQNTALGKITYDSITGDIFIFNLNTLWLQKVSSDLKTVTDFCDFNNTNELLSNSRLYIRAYNGIVYGVDYMESELYSVNRGGIKTRLNTLINNVNMLNRPIGIDLRYPYIYILNSESDNIVIRFLITSGTIETVLSRNTLSSYLPINGIVLNPKSDKIYLNSNSRRIIVFNISDSVPITGSPSYTIGSIEDGYIDSSTTNARFKNITDMCFDSGTMIYVTDSGNNNVIRRIDTTNNDNIVTTYTSGIEKEGRATYTLGTTVQARTIIAPIIFTPTPGVETPGVPLGLADGNNGTVPCSRFCAGTNGGPWSSRIPITWNGATCVRPEEGHSGADCNTTGETMGTVCRCQKSDLGWNPSIHDRYMQNLYSLCVTPTAILSVSYNFGNSQDDNIVDGSVSKRKLAINNTSISAFPLEEIDKEIKLILYKQSPIVLYDNIYLLMIRDSSNLIMYNTITGRDSVIKTLGNESSHIKSMCVHTNGFVFLCHGDRVYCLNIKSITPNYDVFRDEGKYYRNVSIDTKNNKLYVTRTDDRNGSQPSGQYFRFIDRYDLTFGNNTVAHSNKITWTLVSTTENIQSITTYNDTTLIAVGRNIYKLANNGATTSLVKMYGTSTSSQLPGSSYNSYFYPINTITYSNNGNLYIADSNPTSTKRIIERKIIESMEPNKIYTLIGYPEPITDNTSSDSISQMYLDNPTGTAFDMYGNIYVCDAKSVIKINKNDGTLVTVCNNDSIRNIVDVQVNKSGYVYILTNTMLYRCLETSQNVYSQPESISSTTASSTTVPAIGSGFVATGTLGIVASNVRIRDARTMRFDNNENLYIVESYKITNDLNELIKSTTGVASISEYNIICNTLYGITIPTNGTKVNLTNNYMVAPYIGGIIRSNYVKIVSLYGISGSENSPGTGSLKKIYNDAVIARDTNNLNIGYIQTIQTKLQSIYDTLNSGGNDSNDYNTTINFINFVRGTNTSYDSMLNEAEFLVSDGRLGSFIIKGYNSTKQQWETQENTLYLNIFNASLKTLTSKMATVQTHINSIKTIIDDNDAINSKLSVAFITYINDNNSSNNTQLLSNIAGKFNSIWDGTNLLDVIRAQFTSLGIRMGNFLPGIAITTTIDKSKIILKHISIIEDFKILYNNLINQISTFISHLGTIKLQLQESAVTSNATTAETNYNRVYIELYGTGGTETNPTGGIRKMYLDALDTFYLKEAKLTRGLETATTTNEQTLQIEVNQYNRILKIDKYNRVTSIDSLYLYECTGIAFDPDNTMFLVDHYNYSVYMINRSGRYRCALPNVVPYGIAIDNHPNIAYRNVYVSFNKWDLSYNINNRMGHYIKSLRYTNNSITDSTTPNYIIGEINMEATPTDYIKYYGTHKYNQIRLKNPGLISIDSLTNRMIFTQTGLNNVLMTSLDQNTVNKGILTPIIKTIRIEPSAIGNGMSLKRITINVGTLSAINNIDIFNTSFDSARYTLNDSTTNIFPYTPTASQKQYISIGLIHDSINGAYPISVKSIRLYADSNTTGSWVHIGNENDNVSVPAGTLVRYGATNRWIEMTAIPPAQPATSVQVSATSSYFGFDPADGQVKILQKFVPSTQATVDNTCAIGMNVILYDSNGNIISNRKTTNDILNSTGCLLNYENLTESDEYISQ